MRLAVISDVHLEFRGNPPPAVPEADVYVVAGDVHPDARVRRQWLESLPGEVLFVPGNHDFYGAAFPQPHEGVFVREIAGVRFAGATLWTAFAQRWWPDFKRSMRDGRVIEGISWQRLQQTHAFHRRFLAEAAADVVISHHSPTWLTLPPRMETSICNPFYATGILDDEEHEFRRTSLWIHGHVHANVKVRVNGVQVLCHARGYPFEAHLADAFRLLEVRRGADGRLQIVDVVQA